MSAARMALVWMAVGLSGLLAPGKYSGGGGTARDPWRIATKKDLLALAANTKDYASHFILTADIDLSGQTFTMAPIAPATQVGPREEFEGIPFTGTFDGDGHKITGLTIKGKSPKADYLGLFGCIGRGGVVEAVRMEHVSVASDGTAQFLSGLAGLSDGGTVTRCSVEGSVTGARDSADVGAVVGRNGAGGTITYCHALAGAIVADVNVGGLVGHNAAGAKITDCDAGDNVTGRWWSVGGLVGRNEGIIARCQATGDITHGQFTGGAIGGLAGLNDGIIIHCQSDGSVTGEVGSGDLGGLVGLNGPRGAIIACHATGEVTCEQGAYFGGLVGSNEGLITHCYATGSVTGTMVSGGLTGANWGLIAHCYATGSVGGPGASCGGLTGGNEPNGTITNCYATGSVDGLGGVGGLVGESSGAVRNGGRTCTQASDTMEA